MSNFLRGGGITGVAVTQVDAATLRVAVVGRDKPPTGEVTLKTGGLAYSLNPEAEEPDEEIVVTGQQNRYRVPSATGATKTDTPLRDIPQAIQVIPQEVIRDQNITQVQDAIRNVPGANVWSAPSLPDAAISIRGFVLGGFSGNYLRDGLRDPINLSLELSNIERIEVLKGPASVLFGRGLPGGTVNLVTKQPLRDPFYSVEATVGSYDFYRGAVDFSGPLNNSRTVLYRLNTSYKDAGNFVDFVGKRHLLIAPVLSLAIGNRTKLTLEGEYINSADNPFNWGLPAVGTVLPNPNGKIPRNRNVDNPSSTTERTIGRVGYRLEHKFSDNWSLQNAFRALFYRNEQDVFAPASLAPNNRILNRLGIKEQKVDSDYYDLSIDLIGKFSTGSIEHQLLIGTALNSDETRVSTFQGAAAPLDLFNPVYNDTLGPLRRTTNSLTKLQALGIYIQDQIKLAENLKLLLGIRFDTFKSTTENRLANTELEISDDAFSPRVGIVYQPIPPISLYASYSRSFTPLTGTTFGGDPFQPERGTQYEVGIKADLSDRLSTTLAYFDILRSNVTTTDPVNPTFSIQTGEQRSKGFELSLAGEILQGWSIIAGYAYTDARIEADNTFRVGNFLNSVPKHGFNLWTTYEIQQGPLRGFGFGGGFFFVGERQGDLANTFELPSYFRTDAVIFYKRDRFRAQVNFRNLFNVDYFDSAFSRVRVFYGEPFTVQGTISVEF